MVFVEPFLLSVWGPPGILVGAPPRPRVVDWAANEPPKPVGAVAAVVVAAVPNPLSPVDVVVEVPKFSVAEELAAVTEPKVPPRPPGAAAG